MCLKITLGSGVRIITQCMPKLPSLRFNHLNSEQKTLLAEGNVLLGVTRLLGLQD